MSRRTQGAAPVAGWRPTRAQLMAAASKRLPDLLAPGARVWFVGVNPGLYSSAIGHHFGRPGNRFWPALANAGFTPRRLSPFEDATLLEFGLGLTNIAPRTTARAEELSNVELRRGAQRLALKVAALKPGVVAILGVMAYRHAFARPKAQLGLQPEALHGVPVWVLPNPSGLNAHHQLADLSRLFRELLDHVSASRPAATECPSSSA